MSEILEGLSKHSWDTKPLGFFKMKFMGGMRLRSGSTPAVLGNSLQ